MRFGLSHHVASNFPFPLEYSAEIEHFVRKYLRDYSSKIVKIAELKRGDYLIIDNFRMMHSHSAIESFNSPNFELSRIWVALPFGSQSQQSGVWSRHNSPVESIYNQTDNSWSYERYGVPIDDGEDLYPVCKLGINRY